MSTAFISSFTIIFRESLEAVLIVAAIYGYLNQIGETSAKKIINYAWISALVVGGLTFLAANYLFNLTAEHAEMVEGITSIAASVILFQVGVWFVSKAEANKWKEYIESKIKCAISNKDLMTLFLVVFFAVYREVFETILFYKALLLQFDTESISLGFITGLFIVSIISYLILKMSVKLNLRYYFLVTSFMLFVLSISFMGYGITELQEIGMVDTTLISIPKFSLLGIYPTLETTFPQLILVTLLSWSVYKTFFKKTQA